MFVAAFLDPITDEIGEALPRIAGAAVVLLAGLLAAWFAGRLVRRALLAIGLDDYGERFGVHDVLARAGFQRSVSRVLGTAVRVALVVVTVVSVVSLLGFGVLAIALNRIVLFVPKLFVALALVVVGIVIAQFPG